MKTVCCAFLALSTAVFAADDPVNAQQPLRVTVLEGRGEPKQTDLSTSAVSGTVECEESKLYLQPYYGQDTDARNPVIRLSKDGTAEAKFGIHAVEGLTNDRAILRFAPFSGRLYMVAQDVRESSTSPIRTWLVEFSSDGRFVRKTRFEKVFYPTIFVPFNDDRFLIGGTDKPIGPNSKGKEKAFIAIYDASGREISSLSKQLRQLKSFEATEAVFFGDAKRAPDGNIFQLLALETPVIRVISPSGEIVRELQLKPPSPGAAARELHILNGKLIIVYQWRERQRFADDAEGKTLISVYDSTTGDLITSYFSKVKGFPACFDDDAITFLTAGPSGHFGLLRVSLR